MIRTRIYEVLAERRTRGRPVSMTQLAQAAGVHYQTLWRWANNKTRSVNYNMLDTLCRELGCTPGDLLAYIPDAEHPTDA